MRIRFGASSSSPCSACGDCSAEQEAESSRAIRLRMVRAAQEGAPLLRIASAASLHHPAAVALLKETRFLGFERIEVAAEGHTLASWRDDDFRALDFVSRLDLALYGPDGPQHDEHAGQDGAFAATMVALQRWAQLTGKPAGAYGVIHDASCLAEFARAWDDGQLPGTPAFRLSPRGGSLEGLAQAADELPAGPCRQALAQLLPACLFDRPADTPRLAAPGCSFHVGLDAEAPPSGADRLGTFRACVCDGPLREGCPGLAEGWSSELSPTLTPL